MPCVYKATSKTTGKVYVGLTHKLLEERIRDHNTFSRRKKTHFHRAIQKYGIDDFEFAILEECLDPSELGDLEMKWIQKLDSYHSGYNMTKGGEGGVLGYKHTEEVIQTIRENSLGNKNWEGKTHTEKSNYKNMINQPNKKKVGQYSLDNKLINTFDSIRQAQRETQVGSSHISKCCKGVLTHAGGFVWEYLQ